jgi:hypothetical protein
VHGVEMFRKILMRDVREIIRDIAAGDERKTK